MTVINSTQNKIPTNFDIAVSLNWHGPFKTRDTAVTWAKKKQQKLRDDNYLNANETLAGLYLAYGKRKLFPMTHSSMPVPLSDRRLLYIGQSGDIIDRIRKKTEWFKKYRFQGWKLSARSDGQLDHEHLRKVAEKHSEFWIGLLTNTPYLLTAKTPHDLRISEKCLIYSLQPQLNIKSAKNSLPDSERIHVLNRWVLIDTQKSKRPHWKWWPDFIEFRGLTYPIFLSWLGKNGRVKCKKPRKGSRPRDLNFFERWKWARGIAEQA